MGKATRWIRSLFGAKKASSGSNGSASRRQSKTYAPPTAADSYPESLDANKHAIAVAAATAAVAEAALAAAHAAAEVVRLTAGGSSGGGNSGYYGGARRREAAAVKIQSAFRAYLARRALRALKALVKLQALVRGHIVRKQSADMLRRMQAMARVQARASAHRATSSISSSRSSHSYHHPRSGSMSNSKIYFGQERDRQMGQNWFPIEETSWNNKYGRSDDERGDKILEVDTWMPRFNPSPSDESTYDSYRTPKKAQKPLNSMMIREAEYSPRVYSASYRPGSSHKQSPFTSFSRDEYSRSLFGDYPSHPNYMANTESSRAKLRSHSAPRQRSQLFEKSGSTRQLWDYSDTKSERGF